MRAQRRRHCWEEDAAPVRPAVAGGPTAAERQQKRDAETLTAEEHAELIRLVNEVEIWNVRRLGAAAELARLQGVRFSDLVREVGLYPPARG